MAEKDVLWYILIPWYSSGSNNTSQHHLRLWQESSANLFLNLLCACKLIDLNKALCLPWALNLLVLLFLQVFGNQLLTTAIYIFRCRWCSSQVIIKPGELHLSIACVYIKDGHTLIVEVLFWNLKMSLLGHLCLFESDVTSKWSAAR